jgi:hypothetical protein
MVDKAFLSERAPMQTEVCTSACRSRKWHLSYLWAAEFYGAALFLVYVLLIFGHRSMPSLQDFSDWTYEGVLLRNRLLGIRDAAHVLKHYPVPNSAVTLGIACFALFLPWKIAAKLWLCTIFAVALFASRHMMQTCRRSAAIWLIIPSAVFLNTNLWWGFVNFQLGICWEILIASLLLRNEKRDWIFGVLLVVTFFTHMIPFAFAALLVSLYALQSGRIRLLGQLIPSAILSLWYLTGRFLVEHDADGKSGMVSTVRTFSMEFWAFKVESWLKSFGFVNPASQVSSVGIRLLGPQLYLFLFLVNAVLCAAMGWIIVRTAVSAYRERRHERFVWTATLIAALIYLLAPSAALGISDPGSRILQSLLAVVIFLSLGSGTRDRALMTASTCSVLLAASAVFLFDATAFSPSKEGSTVNYLPREIVVFAHIPEHSGDYFYHALDQEEMRFSVWPTAMFLNTPKAIHPH